MFRKIEFVLLSVYLLVFSLHSVSAQSDSFTIKGQVNINGDGYIYIYLVTEEISKTPLTGIQTAIINPSQNDIENKRVLFEFTNVTPGTYGIRCFQDTNSNGKLDRGLFGAKEPWGMSWQGEEPKRIPCFKDFSFFINTDCLDLNITLKQ